MRGGGLPRAGIRKGSETAVSEPFTVEQIEQVEQVKQVRQVTW